MTYTQLKEYRTRLSGRLEWAKDNKLWAHAEDALSELDRVNMEIGRRPEYSGTSHNTTTKGSK